MEHWPNYQDDFVDFKSPTSNPNVVSSIPPSTSNSLATISTPIYPEVDALLQLKQGFSKMMMTMERLEERISRVERTTNQILKNQQETLQVPFMSQGDLDKARQVAEQMEQDTVVAKQLQAAYNKEIELRKKQTQTQQHQSVILSDCPICGVRVNQMDLEVHVDNCLQMFSNDPRKAEEVKDTRKKVESGFFARLFKTNTSTKTTETKVTTTTQSSTPTDNYHEGMIPNYYPPPSHTSHHPQFGYPQFSPPPSSMNMTHHGNNSNGMPMMMPMYMYPSYPATHMTTQLQE